ncbi:MAG: DUF2236 domain-containing protein [Myxococcales bacterium]|nr:DUF2236 domain-containing protein [Myxococcales bacterium]
MIVARAELEAGLAALTAEVRDPRAGLHGPGSPAWAIERDVAIFLGGGRAALLQLAHPFVAYGVHEHSRTRDDVVGRFRRTFDNVFAMAFGTLDDALFSARRVHAIHTRITGVIGEDAGAFPRGTPYHANDDAALTWVWATLVDSVVAVYAALGEPLAPAVRADYYRGAQRFARLFGIPAASLPPTWDAFAAYVAATVASPTLTVTAPARQMAGFLFGGWLGGGARLVTAALLPPPVRAQYALRFGRRERVAYAATIAGLRAARAVTPRAAWDLPAYRDAVHRVRGLPPSRYARFVETRLFALAGRTAQRPR